ncbi:MAG: 3-deoxy-7-phosphoheptulonate synthase [Gammaproteobacteria bacterium]|nr:3-deoxy-7-phosphoheptulonate synthase [Gammaproteobacteria bacterium]
MRLFSVYQLRTKALVADARAAFQQKLEAWGQEFGGVWVPIDGQSLIYYFKGDAPQDALLRLSQWSEVITVVEESAPPFTVSEIANKQVSVKEAQFGAGAASIIAGPCSVEDYDSMLVIAQKLSALGVRALRAGAYKPRASPYAFQGLGIKGLEILSAVSKETGMAIVTEALDPRDIDLVAEHADILQIGSRNMSNSSLLKEVGKANMPVLLKRGMASTIKEFLYAAEYVAIGSCQDIILCERGLRHFDSEVRNILDLSAVALLKQKTGLPVIVAPSHGTGRADLVPSMMCAAAAAGADGFLVEVHDKPQQAWSDADQALSIDNFAQTLPKLNAVLSVFDKTSTPLLAK